MFNKKLLVAALAFSALGNAQAARWSLVDTGLGFGFSDLSATLGGDTVVTGDVTDLEAGFGNAGLTGADFGIQPVASGDADTGYAHTLFVDTLGDSATTALYLGAAHTLGFAATSAGTASGYMATQDVAAYGMKLRIIGDAGEADGTPVMVNFSGIADMLVDAGLPATHTIGIDLDVTQAGMPGSSVSLSWLGNNSWPVDVSFASAVGQELDLTLALHLESTQTSGLSYTAGQHWVAGASAQFDGQLTVSAVPEPERYAMLLAGLGLVGLIARRRV
ncbi:FxDxF family PEP-CTERM protein [Zoogloeaceae bacterium G21618-S1]|jgi:hypothetical protein|nr:FxDxF family PEP-CTERM protein [Zoogloeaceae bacterium G21618-S1]